MPPKLKQPVYMKPQYLDFGHYNNIFHNPVHKQHVQNYANDPRGVPIPVPIHMMYYPYLYAPQHMYRRGGAYKQSSKKKPNHKKKPKHENRTQKKIKHK